MKRQRHGAGREPGPRKAPSRNKRETFHRKRAKRILTDREVRVQSLAWLYPLLSTSLLREFSPKVLRSVADLLLRAASRSQSLARARGRSRRGVSERHGQRVLENLDHRKTQRALTLALRRQARHYLPPTPVDLAVDFHETPYYGQPIDPKKPQYVKTKEERGTHRAYRFVTLALVVKGFRLTLACRYLDHRGRLVAVLQHVVSDARKSGATVGRLFLDREFYGYEVFSWLTAQGIPALVPLRLGSSQRKRFEKGRRSRVTEHTLKDPKGKRPPLTFRVHVVVRYQRGKRWHRHGCQYLVYAVLGPGAEKVPLGRTHEIYRRRFGIESSYRVAHQALPRTSARSVPWRLLYLGVALMLENEWVILRLLYTSEGRQGPGGIDLREELLRFEDLLELLFLGVGRVLGIRRETGNSKPPPRRLKRWGMTR